MELPDEFYSGLQIISSLSKREAEVIARVLTQMEVGNGPEKFEHRIKEELKKKDFSYQELTQVIFLTCSIASYEENDLELIIKKSIDSFIKYGNSLGISDEKEIKSLQRNLLIIFRNVETLKVTAKASRLLFENCNVYSESRIVTDIRCIFPEQVVEFPNSSVIFHTLKMVYTNDNEDKSLYIALDMTDLIALKGQIERAIEKEKVLRANQSKIPFSLINFK